MRAISIGQLAKAAGVGVETVRFYERKGLLDAPPRKESGYRQYDGDAVERLKFIRRAQLVGVTLTEIQDLLALRDDPDARRADVRERAAAKVTDIDAKVRDLLAMRASLTTLLATCEGDGPASDCPIITAFRDEGRNEHTERSCEHGEGKD